MWSLAYFLVMAAALCALAVGFYQHLYSVAAFSYAEDLYWAKVEINASLQRAVPVYSASEFASRCQSLGEGAIAYVNMTEAGPAVLGLCGAARHGRAWYKFAAYIAGAEYYAVDWRGHPAYVVRVAVITAPPALVDVGFYAAGAEAPAVGYYDGSGPAIYYVSLPPGGNLTTLAVEDWPIRAELRVPRP
jgi:hypothetical protein